MKLTITLPLPSRVLSPNASREVHFGTKTRAVKKARRDGYYAAMHAINEAGIEAPRWTKATAKCRFYFKANRGQDGDNALGSAKAYIDSLADAGIVTNDKVIQHQAPEVHFDKQNPRVEIEVREA